MKLLLVGAGQTAVDYSRVLCALDVDIDVVGRSEKTVASFRATTGLGAQVGGVEAYLAGREAPERAIVAVDIASLSNVTLALLRAGVREILVEKPVGITQTSVEAVRDAARNSRAKVFAAYNRRFYASTSAAREQIAEDGGLLSIEFEFTEWTDRVAASAADEAVKQRWVIANSSHVIDLAFHLGGRPAAWQAWRQGALPWHRTGARFSGAGITDQHVSFAYHASWGTPGRWGVTLRTSSHRLRLQPMEELWASTDGIVDQQAEVAAALDQTFKPGLYRQVEAFLSGDDPRLCTIDEHCEMMHVYRTIAGYPGE